VLNASKFALSRAEGEFTLDEVTNPLDRALLASLRGVVTAATEAFDAYDYTSALEAAEQFFWAFCDDYIELVKERAYSDDEGSRSAKAALQHALDVQLRLLAPFLPYVTEETWSWFRDGSIHRSAWPTVDELPEADTELMDDVASALIAVRGAKSNAKVSMRTEVTKAAFSGPADVLERLRAIEADLRAVGRIVGDVTWTDGGDELAVDVELAAQE